MSSARLPSGSGLRVQVDQRLHPRRVSPSTVMNAACHGRKTRLAHQQFSWCFQFVLLPVLFTFSTFVWCQNMFHHLRKLIDSPFAASLNSLLLYYSLYRFLYSSCGKKLHLPARSPCSSPYQPTAR